ncbi:MAG TPA: hypothetical protein DEP84_19210 [Chloroflexi bacterium]|nr:hypothetical protein [Chloroflexota bacterium]
MVVTTLMTRCSLARTRGRAELARLMSADYGGIVVSDCHRVYLHLDLGKRQLCWAHLKQDILGYQQSG